MKTISLPDGTTENLYKPHEVAEMLGYNTRTIRRFLHNREHNGQIIPPKINAVNSNTGGKQPVWWITETEINRLKNDLVKNKM